ncbi:MAG: hypothetical protein CVU97_04190 [Firmicutes bacterium HGW-Firmicutes-21]|nr:MAG: hypothetical protein CVU97_04190 [Firmicutes bacterium HGW-Firmicutes-21]
MLGLGDFGIFSAYALCILSMLGCIIYGIFNWNKGNAPEKEEIIKKERDWDDKEQEIGENLDI